MVLDEDIKQQLGQYLKLLENPVEFRLSQNHSAVIDFLNEVKQLSPKLSIVEGVLPRDNSFEIAKPEQSSGIVFSGVPLGHEFSSFILALLQVSGRAPRISEESIQQIKAIQQPLAFETYVSLSCHNCPDVVQALNIMSVLNPNIKHTMIEGSLFQDEVQAKQIMAVPSIYLNGEEFASGRMTLEDILRKIGEETPLDVFLSKPIYDVLVIGGGPAGNSAAIYAARKGLTTGLLAETYGGQVMDTVGIENMIGTVYTEGSRLMAQIEAHANEYKIDIMKGQRVKHIDKKELIEVQLANSAILKAKTAVIAVGARWRNVGVPGEEQFRTKGVTNCPHCDGPLFTGKTVTVIGGGNSGIEAAIDLSGLAKTVYVLEFLPELKADAVLQNRAKRMGNIEIFTNVVTKSINGTTSVESITYENRETNEEVILSTDGIFVQIGLLPNTDWLKDSIVELNSRGEIIVGANGETNVPGIFAAGDCTNSVYKQIIISMGSGATAALGAFDYLIRHT